MRPSEEAGKLLGAGDHRRALESTYSTSTPAHEVGS
jgi:hypothetical protein